MPDFSQPLRADDEAGDAPVAAGAVNDTLLSMAATLALRDGNPDQIRAQLPSDELRARFDIAYAVQQMRDGGEGKSALERRTTEEVEKRRAARAANEAMRLEEETALFEAAKDQKGKVFNLMTPIELDQLPEAEPLIEGFLVKQSVIRLYGPPKSYKSFVMLDMAGCVGAGIPWCGNKTTQAKVLYVVAEGVRGIRRRVRAWEAQNKRAMVGVHFYERAVQLGDRADVSALIRTAARGKFEFIILDTQARCTVGLEENSASEMGVVVAALDVLKEVTGACVALVHHSGAQGGRARGSTAILGALDAEFEVRAQKQDMSVEVLTRAQKDLAEARSVEFDLVTPLGGSLAVKPRADWHRPSAADLPPLTERDGEALRHVAHFGDLGITIAQLAKRMGGDADDTRAGVAALMKKGCLVAKGNTLYLDRIGRLYVQVSDQQLPES